MANTNTKKQMKISKLFSKRAKQPQEDFEDLEEEMKQLEQVLKEKQDYLFQLQRNGCRRKTVPLKKIDPTFIRPEEIVLTNSVETLKYKLELMSMLSGMEVQSFVVDEHCAIVYQMQHDAEHQLKHGLRIEMTNGVNKVSKSSLPLGFNLSEVLDGFDNVMLPECLVAVRSALVAYYDRLGQFEQLKKMVYLAQMFKITDGSHMEITFSIQSEHDAEAEPIQITLMLDYRIYDIRPKRYSFLEKDMPEEAVEVLRNQCSVFKWKPLQEAFKEAFIDGNGGFVLDQEYLNAALLYKKGTYSPQV